MAQTKWTTVKVGRKTYHINALLLACGRSIATVHNAKGQQLAQTPDYATAADATAAGVRVAFSL